MVLRSKQYWSNYTYRQFNESRDKRRHCTKQHATPSNTQTNFQSDTITTFGESVNLIVTKSKHYAAPITKSKRLINDISNTTQVTLTVTQSKSTRDIVTKLH